MKKYRVSYIVENSVSFENLLEGERVRYYLTYGYNSYSIYDVVGTPDKSCSIFLDKIGLDNVFFTFCKENRYKDRNFFQFDFEEV